MTTELSQEDFLDCLQGLSEDGNKVAGLIRDLLTTECDSSYEAVSGLVADACDQATKLASTLFDKKDIVFAGTPDPYNQWYRYGREASGVQRATHSPTLHQAGVVAQLWPGSFLGIDNKPGVLSSMIAMGLLGAGLGNLSARGLEKVRGGKNKKTRRTMTLAGAGLGMLPGLAYGGLNKMQGKSFFATPSGENWQKESSVVAYHNQHMAIPSKITGMVWHDPYIADHLPKEVAVGITAAMEGARRIGRPYSPSPYVTPGDIARVAVGAGGGYLGGYTAGKALGALFGVSPQTQNVLRKAGVFAGVINKVVPLIYGK